MPAISASPRDARAIQATDELLTKLRAEHVFVGAVAHAAWLGGELTARSIDVLALTGPQQKSSIAMMAGNRGFRVDRDEVEQADQLDLVPLNFVGDDGEVRVHVLLATNALYARMVTAGQEAQVGETAIRVAAPEDLALMLTMAEDEVSVRRLVARGGFNLDGYNERLVSIGLRELVIAG
ncbi:MAG TPA: hypothetical protein VFN10_01875 [Thermoanaerobaculia bacterium]|nr:hypothetical protein [Thermoanaerobaculia bacterium]